MLFRGHRTRLRSQGPVRRNRPGGEAGRPHLRQRSPRPIAAEPDSKLPDQRPAAPFDMVERNGAPRAGEQRRRPGRERRKRAMGSRGRRNLLDRTLFADQMPRRSLSRRAQLARGVADRLRARDRRVEAVEGAENGRRRGDWTGDVRAPAGRGGLTERRIDLHRGPDPAPQRVLPMARMTVSRPNLIFRLANGELFLYEPRVARRREAPRHQFFWLAGAKVAAAGTSLRNGTEKT